jgi:RNA recognition motif-containing protein
VQVSELTSSSTNIDISIDPFTGRNPSYCFVDFNTTGDALNALHLIGGQEVRGRPVKINAKTAKCDPIYHENNQNPSRRAFSDNVDKKAGPYAFDRWTQHDAVEHWTAPIEDGRRLYVGGLPRMPDQGTANVEMRKLFRNFNVQAVSKVIWPHPSTKYKPGDHHYCFVDLATAEEAQEAALLFNGRVTPYGGRYRVSPSSKLPSKLIREQLGGMWPGTEPKPRERNLHGNWRRVEDEQSGICHLVRHPVGRIMSNDTAIAFTKG